jgi:hypothetical protein
MKLWPFLGEIGGASDSLGAECCQLKRGGLPTVDGGSMGKNVVASACPRWGVLCRAEMASLTRIL